MTSPLDELKAMYPVFQFKNKTNSPEEIQLDGDTITVNGRGTLKLDSRKFINLPPISKFKFEKPTLDDLRAVGLLDSPKPFNISSSSSITHNSSTSDKPAGDKE